MSEEQKEKAFKKDANVLFSTSIDYRLAIYLRHKAKISQELLDDYAHHIRYFIEQNKVYELGHTFMMKIAIIQKNYQIGLKNTL